MYLVLDMGSDAARVGSLNGAGDEAGQGIRMGQDLEMGLKASH